MDIEIELLQLDIDNAGAFAHRVETIATRAAEILADRLQDRVQGRPRESGPYVARIEAQPMQADLSRMSDERAASLIANSWLQALTLKLEAGA
jgi:hypothetical protein